MDDSISTEEAVERLFASIKHGDEEHQAWLREALAAHFAGDPIPAPRGSGNKEARIVELERQIAALTKSPPVVSNPTQSETLLPCRKCGADCRPELFPDNCGDVDFQTTVWLCSQHKMFGGKCPSDTAYLTEEAWNTRLQSIPSPLLDEGLVERLCDLHKRMMLCFEGATGEPPPRRPHVFEPQWQDLETLLDAALSIPRLEAGRVTVDNEAEALELFAEYFRRNYPGPNTIIGNPDWHAPKIFRAALHAMSSASAPDGLPLVERMRDLPRLIELQREGTIDDLRDEGWNAGLERAAAMVSAALTELEEKSK